MKKLTIRESAKPRLRFEKDQYDHYTIYDGNEEVGYISCTNYYSAGNQAYRNWIILINFGKGETYDDNEIGSITKAKQTAAKLYDYALGKHAEWMSVFDD